MPKPNRVAAAILEALDGAKGSGTLAQSKARALYCKWDELVRSLRDEFSKTLADFRSDRAASMAKEEQLLGDAIKNFRQAVQ